VFATLGTGAKRVRRFVKLPVMEKIIGMQEARTPTGVAASIYEVQQYSSTDTPLDSNGPPTGIKRFELADGRPLKMVGRGEYQVEGTDEVFLVKGQ